MIESWDRSLGLGETIRLDRLALVRTSQEAGDPARVALQELNLLLQSDVEFVIGAHIRAWESWWDDIDLAVEGDPESERALRFAAYLARRTGRGAGDDFECGRWASTLPGPQPPDAVTWPIGLTSAPVS